MPPTCGFTSSPSPPPPLTPSLPPSRRRPSVGRGDHFPEGGRGEPFSLAAPPPRGSRAAHPSRTASAWHAAVSRERFIPPPGSTSRASSCRRCIRISSIALERFLLERSSSASTSSADARSSGAPDFSSADARLVLSSEICSCASNCCAGLRSGHEIELSLAAVISGRSSPPPCGWQWTGQWSAVGAYGVSGVRGWVECAACAWCSEYAPATTRSASTPCWLCWPPGC